MAVKKRKYEAAFKQEALRLLAISGKRMRQIEDKLGITPGLLNKWKQRYQLHPMTGEVKPSKQHDLEAENRRLRRELTLAQAERDLLKKGREAVCGGCAMRYACIQSERGGLPVDRACRLLKVYYVWQKRQRQSCQPNPAGEIAMSTQFDEQEYANVNESLHSGSDIVRGQ
jgi:transposase